MSLKHIHNTLISGRSTVITSIILVSVMRLYVQPDLSDIAFWATLLLHIGISLTLLRINYLYTIIRSRTVLPSVLFLLMTTSSPMFYTEWKGSLAVAGTMICMINLFSSYQKPESQINALNIGLILTLCSFAWAPILYLFPLFWCGFYNFQSLNFKTFFASIIGIILVWLFVFVWSICNGGIQIFMNTISGFEGIFELHPLNWNLREWIVFSFVFVLVAISGIKIFLSGISEKIRTETYLKNLFLASICLVTAMIFQSEWDIWVLLVYLPISFILSHFFTLSTHKITSCTLIFFIIFFVGIYAWRVLL